jgi:predicted small secreted protein
MKRFALLLAISLVVASCATMQSQSQDLVSRAVQAVGGAGALAGVTTVYEKGTVRQWEPEQSAVAGGEMRFTCESVFEAITDVPSRTTSIDWGRKFAYPSPRTFTFSEIVTPDVGYVSGIDAMGTEAEPDAKPPAHNMSAPPRHHSASCAPALLLLDVKGQGTFRPSPM